MLTVPDADDQPATERLLRPYFGMHRFDWPDDESVEFHLGHGDMIRRSQDSHVEHQDLNAGPSAPPVTESWLLGASG